MGTVKCSTFFTTKKHPWKRKYKDTNRQRPRQKNIQNRSLQVATGKKQTKTNAQHSHIHKLYATHTHTHTHTHTDKAINRPGGRQIQTNRITPHNLTSTRTRTCKNKDTNPYPHIHMNIHIQISTDTNTYTLANLH